MSVSGEIRMEPRIEKVVKGKRQSLWAEVWRRLKQNRMAMVGLGILAVLVVCAIFAPLIAPYDPLKIDVLHRLEPPSPLHWLGTDNFGRDIFSRIVYGSRVSLYVGFIAVGIGAFFGGLIGGISGYFGGRLDNLIMRLMDVLLAVPQIILALAIVSVFGTNLTNVMIAVGVSILPRYARVVRASALSVREQEYVEAERAIGTGNFSIIVETLIPNCMAPIIVQSTLGVAKAILSAATLSFLGMGIQPPTPEWGSMLSAGRQFLRNAPHITIFPGLAIVIVVISLNMLGDGLRDALDPRLRQ